VVARLKRLNPDGVEEGSYPRRGWHRKPPARRWDLNAITFAEFRRRFGREAAERLPKAAIFKPCNGGRRKLVAQWAVKEFA